MIRDGQDCVGHVIGEMIRLACYDHAYYTTHGYDAFKEMLKEEGSAPEESIYSAYQFLFVPKMDRRVEEIYNECLEHAKNGTLKQWKSAKAQGNKLKQLELSINCSSCGNIIAKGYRGKKEKDLCCVCEMEFTSYNDNKTTNEELRNGQNSTKYQNDREYVEWLTRQGESIGVQEPIGVCEGSNEEILSEEGALI